MKKYIVKKVLGYTASAVFGYFVRKGYERKGR